MADNGMTIVDVKKAKIELEANVLKLMTDFEESTGTKLQYMSKTRQKDKEEKDGCCCHPHDFNSDRGPIVDITFELELDLD